MFNREIKIVIFQCCIYRQQIMQMLHIRRGNKIVAQSSLERGFISIYSSFIEGLYLFIFIYLRVYIYLFIVHWSETLYCSLHFTNLYQAYMEEIWTFAYAVWMNNCPKDLGHPRLNSIVDRYHMNYIRPVCDIHIGLSNRLVNVSNNLEHAASDTVYNSR